MKCLRDPCPDHPHMNPDPYRRDELAPARADALVVLQGRYRSLVAFVRPWNWIMILQVAADAFAAGGAHGWTRAAFLFAAITWAVASTFVFVHVSRITTKDTP
jgi:hypothetical protein